MMAGRRSVCDCTVCPGALGRAAARNENPLPHPRLIAVIEDDPSLCQALTGLLRSVGYAASGFASADHFLAANTALRIDCIITDIQMPGTGGIDLKHQLTARGCEAPVIMITGRDDAALLARAEASGAVCILRKPFAAERLIACVARAIGSE